MKSDPVYLAHVLECIRRIREDVALRNLQTMAESTQRLQLHLVLKDIRGLLRRLALRFKISRSLASRSSRWSLPMKGWDSGLDEL